MFIAGVGERFSERIDVHVAIVHWTCHILASVNICTLNKHSVAARTLRRIPDRTCKEIRLQGSLLIVLVLGLRIRLEADSSLAIFSV